MSPRTQSPLTLEYILLGIIDQKPIHGYDLYKKISEINGISLIWQIKQSQLYALLDKLEADGLLTIATIPGESRPARQEYSLTNTGKTAFKDWMTSPVFHARQMRQEFLARLYFAHLSGKSDVLRLVEQQKALANEWLQAHQTRFLNTDQDHVFEQLVYSFRVHQVQGYINWLDNCKDLLE
jgi:PadR family transcriptional regulator, regulatory protein AphA